MINRQLPVALLLLFTIINVGCSTDDIYEGAPTTASSQQQNAIGFGTYLKRATQTRGAAYLEPSEIALNGGIGVFAMNTSGGKYDPSSNDSKDTKNFTANLMQNMYLHSSLSESELYNNETSTVAGSWVYNPIRYWPNGNDDYVSFMAYAPYNPNNKDYSTLYDKDGNPSGDRTYIKHIMESDPLNQVDLLYSGSKTTNMQLLGRKDNWKTVGDFGTIAANDTVPPVQLKFNHANSRIGFAITSSALKDPNNFTYETQGGEKYSFGDVESGLAVDLIVSATSANSIEVNKVVFLGDNSTAENEHPTGAFYSSGYLNLATTTSDKPLWSIKDKTQLPFIYDNTGTVRMSNGDLLTLAESQENDYRFYDNDNNPISGYLLWIPSDLVENVDNLVEEYTYYVNVYGNYIFYQMIDALEGWGEDIDYINSLTKEQIIRLYCQYVYEVYYVPSLRGNMLNASWTPSSDGTVDESNISVNYIGNSNDDYMFVIPQDFSEGNTEGNELWVYLDYTLHYTGGVSGDVAKNGINYKFYCKVEKKFEPGKAYIIVMDIGEGKNFNAVKFSVKETAWPSEDHSTVSY